MTKTVGRHGMSPGIIGTAGRVVQVDRTAPDPEEARRIRREFWERELENPENAAQRSEIMAILENL